MKKDQIITAAYIFASLGLFVLAIDMWICGGEIFCRQNNSLSAKIANAAININFDTTNGSRWSGPADPNFDINFESSSAVMVIPPTSGDGGGDDGAGDGH